MLRKPTVAIFALILCLALGSCGRQEPNPVFFLGVDGATWDVIDPMIARGELPNFARLKRDGAWGRLITVGPQVSPVIWTTFATGHFGRRHGILDFTYPYTPGPKKPVESSVRREPALWNLASQAGLSVAVTGYFASYPAEPVNGVMVTDRVYQRLPDSVYPADALEPIAEELDRQRTLPAMRTMWSRFLPWDFNPHAETPPDPRFDEANRMVAKRVERNILNGEYLRTITNHLLERQPWDLFIGYFRNPDFAAHSLWWYYDPSEYEQQPDPFTRELLGDVVPESYRFIDDILGEFLDRLPENANVVIASDHGTGSATGRYTIKKQRHKEQFLNGNHRPDGVFLAYGPDIRPGELERMTIMEVFPLLATLLGLPVADAVPGELDYRVLAEDFTEDFPVTRVPEYTWQRAERSGQAAVAAQQDTVESLRGLGYIGEGFEFGDREDAEAGFWDAELELVMFNVTGELVYWVLQDDVDAAIAVLKQIWTHRPDVARLMITRVTVEFEVIAERFPEGYLDRTPHDAFLERAHAIQEGKMQLLRELDEAAAREAEGEAGGDADDSDT